jgi:transposase InsO family protein
MIKTDNGPGYTSQKFKQFCSQLHINHITGIPYNPQRKGIVERAHQTLKNTLISWLLRKQSIPLKEIQNCYCLMHSLC